MPRTSHAKQNMIESAMRLQRKRGVFGTAFSDVIADSGAPRGSIYHHFPGGRAQVAAGALDAEPDSLARVAAREGFQRWQSLLAGGLERAGIPGERAQALAVMCIAATEGALILVRARGDEEPLRIVAEQLRDQLAREQAGAAEIRT